MAQRAESHRRPCGGHSLRQFRAPPSPGPLAGGGVTLEAAPWPRFSSREVWGESRSQVTGLPGLPGRPPPLASQTRPGGGPGWAPGRSCGLTSSTCGCWPGFPRGPAATDAASWRPRDLAPLPAPATGASARQRGAGRPSSPDAPRAAWWQPAGCASAFGGESGRGGGGCSQEPLTR